MGRTFRLAKLFEQKYGLSIIAQAHKKTTNEIKRNLLNAYNLYVNPNSAKDPVLQILADAGEPFSKHLLELFNELIAGIDDATAADMFSHIGQMLGFISKTKNDPKKSVRNFIHDAVRVTKESERNYREHLKSKFEMIISRLSSILEKQSRELQEISQLEGPLEGTKVEPQRKELSKQKLLMFMRTPAAQDVGLNSIEAMTSVLSDPELKYKLTTLINAVDRGHMPVDGYELKNAVLEIMKIHRDKQRHNLELLEDMPEKSAPPVSLLGMKAPEEG